MPQRGAVRAANRFSAASSWPKMRTFADGDSGVSGRAMRPASTGTSGAYLRARRTAFGPLVWMTPTPLSVKSDTLITHASGQSSRLAATCARYYSYCSSSLLPGTSAGLWNALDALGPSIRMVFGVRSGLRHPRRLTVLAIAGEAPLAVFYALRVPRAVQRRRPRIAVGSALVAAGAVARLRAASAEPLR